MCGADARVWGGGVKALAGSGRTCGSTDMGVRLAEAKYNNSICLSGEFVISGISRTFAGHPVCYFNLPFLLSFV